MARVVALLATAALLGVGVAIATMVRPDSDSHANDQAVLAEPTPTPTPHRAKKAEKKASKPRLTKSQRAARTAAVAELRRRGYRPVRLSDWHAHQTLRVLVGRQGDGRQAFFFVGRRYIGNDSSTLSGRLRVGGQSSRTVTLVYSLWRSGDKACCPHGGTTRVRFRWEGGRLRPLGAIPNAAARRPAIA